MCLGLARSCQVMKWVGLKFLPATIAFQVLFIFPPPTGADVMEANDPTVEQEATARAAQEEAQAAAEEEEEPEESDDD